MARRAPRCVKNGGLSAHTLFKLCFLSNFTVATFRCLFPTIEPRGTSHSNALTLRPTLYSRVGQEFPQLWTLMRYPQSRDQTNRAERRALSEPPRAQNGSPGYCRLLRPAAEKISLPEGFGLVFGW